MRLSIWYVKVARVSSLSTLLLLALAALPQQARAAGPEDIVGTWKMVTSFNGQDNESEVTFALKDGVLTGAAAGRRGTRELLDVTYENGQLGWGIIMPRAGNEPLRITVTVTGNTFEGGLKTPLGEAKVRGTKWTEESEKAAAEKLKAALGEWDIITTNQGKDTEGTMRIYLDEENDLRLSFITPGTELDIRRVRFEGDRMSFAAVLPFVGEEAIRGQVTFTENKCEGGLEGPLGAVAIRGSMIDTTKLVLAPYDDPAPVLGNWDVVANVNGTESKAKLAFMPDGERVKGTVTTDNGSFDSQEVDFKKVGDKMGRVRLVIVIPDLGEKAQTFELIFSGDSFEGEEINSNGAIFFSGSRAAG
ncbi:MAG TPA: hypothetical protein PLJ47_03610 [Candidatus Hydrogenedentes bacterium]|nr:hypothetical protein [Candidatus Hydrogenedentota bacterium]HRK33660.1 hypothetical protein [Candidatus Hydrogenedentota bacterium]